MPPIGVPPRTRGRGLSAIDVGRSRHVRRGFWAGWGGVTITMIIGALVVALLVGWILLWVKRPGGPSVSLLVLGCIAYSLVLMVLFTLLHRIQASHKLRQVEAAFLSGMSHNLRTPISAIRAAAQTLDQAEVTDEERHRLIEGIVHETRRLGLRVDSILEAGRLEVEHRAYPDEVFRLGDLVTRSVDGMRGVVTHLGGSIEFAAHLPVMVAGDTWALQLMLDNLLDNAVKYCDAPPEVTVVLQRRDPFAVLQIRDRGMGFEPAATGDLFRRSWRGDTGKSGMGLGLFLARAIARGHLGELYLHSDGRGRGAVAEVWLPMVKDG